MITPMDALEQLDAWRQARPATRTTGFAELDDVTGGFEPGQVWMVVGTPGQGRSSLAVQWASLLAGTHGFDTQLVSKRDPARKVAARLAASATKVPELHLWHGHMSDEDATRLSHAKRILAAMPLRMVDPGGISIADTDMDEVARPEVLVVDDADLAGGLFPSRVASLAAAGVLLVLSLPRDLVVSSEGVDAAWSRVADVIDRHRSARPPRPCLSAARRSGLPPAAQPLGADAQHQRGLPRALREVRRPDLSPT